jgi:hypothetical protein
MTDTVTIRGPSTTTYNPATMAYDTVAGATLYAGPADVKPLDVQGREVQAGEREVALRFFDVRVPFSVTADFARDDLVTVDASADPSLAGRVLTVTGVSRGGRRTARHLDAEDRS